MARPAGKHPTDLELEILQVLWNSGPCSGSQIRESLPPGRESTYQSVMTVLGIMEEKKYVSRKKVNGRFEYRSRVTQKTTARRMMLDLANKLFNGSASVAMVSLLESSDLSDEELTNLRNELKRSPRKQDR